VIPNECRRLSDEVVELITSVPGSTLKAAQGTSIRCVAMLLQ
jgi:hypothetical protein